MQRLSALLLPLLLPLTATAAGSLKDSLAAYEKVRMVEEKIQGAKDILAADGPQSVPEWNQWQKDLEEARKDFQAGLQDGFSGWEAGVVKNWQSHKPLSGSQQSEAISFLKENYPGARSLSPLRWEIFAEWFGPEVHREFLTWAFELKPLPPAAGKQNTKVIWVMDPFRRLLSQKEIWEKEDLEKFDHVETIEVSAFSQIENQADELRHILLSRDQEPYFLVTTGEASAIMHKLLDLYPSFRGRKELRAWINLDGRLYGRKFPASRGLASSPVPGPAERFESESLKGLKKLRLERLSPPTPLGEGFPILNLVSLDKEALPELRDALVMDGSSWIIGKRKTLETLQDARAAASLSR